jgi:hypothetical protein
MGLDYQAGFTEICTFIEPENARQSNQSCKEFCAAQFYAALSTFRFRGSLLSGALFTISNGVSSAQEQRSITVPDEDTTGNLVTLQAGMTVTAFERDSDENGIRESLAYRNE